MQTPRPSRELGKQVADNAYLRHVEEWSKDFFLELEEVAGG